jgi:RNA polymerase sigma factor (sigma-70 family)
MAEKLDKVFIQLINQNIRIAHKIGSVYCQDPHDREDLQQEMMYQLWKSYPRFDGRSKFSTWMYKVCLNTALTYKRKTEDRRQESIDHDHYQIPEQMDGANEENLALLFKAIAALSPLNKAIVLLYLDDLPYEEISNITGLTKTNVSVRLVRIKKELELLLKKQNSIKNVNIR